MAPAAAQAGPGAIADVESRGERLLSRAEVDPVSLSQSAPIVIVGAGGFIGRALVARLAQRGVPVTAVVRRAAAVPPGVALHAIGDITASTDWAPLLRGARAVVHLASRAHAPLGADLGWIEGDAAAAAQLAREAGRAGVERLVLVSSIKVLGEATDGVPFRAGRPAAPGDTYGFAKWYIEEAMRHAGAATPALTVIRPPLVYGPGVTANFRALLRLVDRAPPLPFASIANRRSLVFLDNLIDLIELALSHPAARDGTFLLRDEEEVSTPDLVRRIARALHRPARLFPCPPSLLRLAARLAGRRGAADRLLGSLSIDDSATRERLGWRPGVTLDDGLAETCRWYRSEPAGARPLMGRR
jgi:nucleoside-diphosphate-sugar epimerase